MDEFADVLNFSSVVFAGLRLTIGFGDYFANSCGVKVFIFLQSLRVNLLSVKKEMRRVRSVIVVGSIVFRINPLDSALKIFQFQLQSLEFSRERVAMVGNDEKRIFGGLVLGRGD